MEELSPSLLGVLAGIVGVITVGVRVIEKLIDALLKIMKERRERKNTRDLPSRRGEGSGSRTQDIVQATNLKALCDDMDAVYKLLLDVKEVMAKEHMESAHKAARAAEKMDEVVAQLRELNKAHVETSRGIDNNTTATKALHNFLARRVE